MQAQAIAGFTSSWTVSGGIGGFSSTGTRRDCSGTRYVLKRARAPVVAPARTPVRCVATENESCSAVELVDSLLERITKYDGGPSTTLEQRTETDELVNRLASLGEQLGSSYLTDPRLLGNYQVSYASSKSGYAPAGGRFVTRLGRLIFVGRGSFQHVISENTAVNMVAFRLLGLIPGVVGLYGKIIPDSTMGKNGVMIQFDRPRIMLGPIVFRFAQTSKVRLRIAYLDERVRIGIGSRGSLFVFTNGGLADEPVADEWKYLFGDGVVPLPGVLLPLAVAMLVLSVVALLVVLQRST